MFASTGMLHPCSLRKCDTMHRLGSLVTSPKACASGMAKT
jgi:hypothetical protein